MPSQPTNGQVVGVSAVADFGSILFPDPDPDPELVEGPPAHFSDLNLDQLVATVLLGRDEYDLAGFFHSPLRNIRTVTYRQQVGAEVDQEDVRSCLTRFGRDMVEARRQLARCRGARFELQRQAWYLAGATAYADAVVRLDDALEPLPLTSAGLAGFRAFLRGYVTSPGFQRLREQAQQTRAALDAADYRLQIQAGRVIVSLPEDEADYTADVLATFARFRQGAAQDHRVRIAFSEEMNHVEEEIALRVAKLCPGPFAALAQFTLDHPQVLHEALTRFDREVQVYLAWAEFADRMRRAGLTLCYPEVTDKPTPLRVADAWDATLAAKLTAEARPVVVNAVDAAADERIWVVTGANQGGKTSWARTVGQLVYLSSLGLSVPGQQATVPLCDQVLTHFERGENSTDLTGKLDDDLTRVHDILQRASPRSLLVVNEIFTSTSAADAAWLSTKVLERVARLGCLCVWVTFVDELTTLPRTVSLVAGVDPTEPGRRTFHVTRRPADGHAYARALAVRYRLDPASLKERLPS